MQYPLLTNKWFKLFMVVFRQSQQLVKVTARSYPSVVWKEIVTKSTRQDITFDKHFLNFHQSTFFLPKPNHTQGFCKRALVCGFKVLVFECSLAVVQMSGQQLWFPLKHN